MKASDYVQRVLDELPWRRAKIPKLSAGFAAVVLALSGILIVLFAVLIFFKPSDEQTAGNCAFYITNAAAPPPVTDGDAAKLDTCVQFKTVSTPSTRTLGLSGRTSLPWDRGMLFDFERPGKYCMWMKDMNFSLDMIWLNEKNRIVAQRENVTPDTYPQTFCGPETARYVLEVNSGVIEAGGLRIGQRLNL